MKISCQQENLAKGLSIVGRAAASRSVTLLILANVLLHAEGDRLRLSTNNLEMGISCWIKAKVEQGGAVTVPEKVFSGLIGTLSPEVVKLSLSDKTQTLHLECGRTEANIKGIDADEFPIVPEPDDSEKVFFIKPDVLRKMIAQVAFAAAGDESRPMLTGVMTAFDGDKITMAAADGFRLSVRTSLLSSPVPNPQQALVPAKAMSDLARIMGDQEQDVEISITPTRNQIIFHLTDIDLVTQLIDLKFPDYDPIIPKTHTTRVVVNADDVKKVGRAANIFARDSSSVAKFKAVFDSDEGHSGKVVVAARSDETGSNEGEIDAYLEGEEIEIALNIKYFLDAIAAIDTQQVAIEMTTPNSPVLIQPVGDDDFVHVIMPMHLGK